MIIWLTLATCLAAVLLLVVVAINLWRIIRELECIGGVPISWLAKIRLGLFHSALPSLDADLLERVSQIDSLTCSLRLHSDLGRGGELPESPGDLAH